MGFKEILCTSSERPIQHKARESAGSLPSHVELSPLFYDPHGGGGGSAKALRSLHLAPIVPHSLRAGYVDFLLNPELLQSVLLNRQLRLVV